MGDDVDAAEQLTDLISFGKMNQGVVALAADPRELIGFHLNQDQRVRYLNVTEVSEAVPSEDGSVDLVAPSAPIDTPWKASASPSSDRSITPTVVDTVTGAVDYNGLQDAREQLNRCYAKAMTLL